MHYCCYFIFLYFSNIQELERQLVQWDCAGEENCMTNMRMNCFEFVISSCHANCTRSMQLAYCDITPLAWLGSVNVVCFLELRTELWRYNCDWSAADTFQLEVKIFFVPSDIFFGLIKYRPVQLFAYIILPRCIRWIFEFFRAANDYNYFYSRTTMFSSDKDLPQDKRVSLVCNVSQKNYCVLGQNRPVTKCVETNGNVHFSNSGTFITCFWTKISNSNLVLMTIGPPKAKVFLYREYGYY